MHRQANTPIHKRWMSMRNRCYGNTKSKWYKNRGIVVCDEWNVFTNFRDWSLSNGFSPELELDRIDNNGNYCPENCRWTTRTMNNRNRNNTRLTVELAKEIKDDLNRGLRPIDISRKLNIPISCTCDFRGRSWNDAISDVQKVQLAKIVTWGYYKKTNPIDGYNPIHDNGLVGNLLVNDGFKYLYVRIDSHVKDIRGYILHNFMELTQNSSLIIYWHKVNKTGLLKKLHIYYKPI